MECVNHPGVETRVTCSSCGDPICPDCMVFSAVGAKCPSCARVPKSARVTLKPGKLTQTVLVGLGAALAGGIFFGLFTSMIGFFSIIIAFGVGYGVGEAVSWGSGRYHSSRLAAWAVFCAGLAILVGRVFSYAVRHGFSLEAFTVLYSVPSFWFFIWLLAAGFAAWRRNA